jgi:transcriptional regulator with XRE-family HTH domain
MDLKSRHVMMASILRASIASQVRALRLSRELTQEQVAEGIGTQASCIARVEDPRGEWMSLSTLTQIANFFDVALLAKFTGWPEWLREYAPAPFTEEMTLPATQEGQQK